MDFSFSSEQTQLADATRRYLTSEYSFEARQKAVHSELGYSEAAWRQLTELGLLALAVPEAQDGFGGNAVDLLVVMQELGRGLVVEPVAATLFAAEFVKRAGTAEQRELLRAIAAGTEKWAAALHERDSRHELNVVGTSARREAGGYVLNGVKTVAVHAGQADRLVVSARTSGAPRDESGLSLFLVDVKTAGVSREDYRTIDGLRAADVTFKSVALPESALIGQAGEGWPLLEAVADFGVALACAEAVGVMETLNQLTLEYTKTRKQFGVPIAKFQALQHRMVNMFIEFEQARSMAYLAAVRCESTDDNARRLAVAAAKVRVGRAARLIGQEAVQLHGGMGVTNELAAAHYFKRLTLLEVTLGDTDHHLQRFIAATRQSVQSVPLRAAA